MTFWIVFGWLLALSFIFTWAVYGDDIKSRLSAWRELRQHNKVQKAHKKLIRECFEESREWEERKAERDRRRAEREQRRAA
jgi:hypothetical protein